MTKQAKLIITDFAILMLLLTFLPVLKAERMYGSVISALTLFAINGRKGIYFSWQPVMPMINLFVAIIILMLFVTTILVSVWRKENKH